jgi:hypothetical protein
MKPISFETVEQTWRQASEMSPQEGKRLVRQISGLQPEVLGYLLGSGDHILNPDEKELLLYLGVVVWKIMSQGPGQLLVVAKKTLRTREEANFNLIKTTGTDSPGINQLLKNYNQPEVLSYVVKALMEADPQATCLIKDKNKETMIVYLKTVIDCFDM